MSKIKIIVVALITAIIAGGYWFSQQSSQTTSSGQQSNLLSRVPADTLLFMGGLEAIPFVNPYDAETMKNLQSDMGNQFKHFENLIKQHPSPATTVAMVLYMDLANEFYSGNITKINDFAVYTLGVYPVVAWQSSDVAAFVNRLDTIEKDKNITSRSFKLATAELREYIIDDDAPVKLVIAINGNTVSLGAVSNNEKIHKLLAGVDFPEQNIQSTNKLKNLMTAHKLLPFAFGFFDFNIAMTNLSSQDDNLLKATLKEVSEGKNMPDIAADVCFTDAAKIIARWPRTVFGYRTYDIKHDPMLMDAAFIFEHTDNKFLTALKDTLGAIPDYSMEHDTMSMGIGVNIDNVATLLADIRNDIMNETYQCEQLVEMQQQVAQNDPAMLAMGTQMVAGVQGVSVHLTNVDITAATSGDMTKLEGMAVIMAKNPKNLLMVASNFYPPLGQMTIEVNGESQKLSLPMGIEANIMMSEHAITLQFGESDELKNRIANIHQGKGLSPSLMRSGMDLSNYFKMLEPMMSDALAQASPEDTEQMQNMMKLFEKLNMKFVYDFNVEDKGIAINLKMSMTNAAKK